MAGVGNLKKEMEVIVIFKNSFVSGLTKMRRSASLHWPFPDDKLPLLVAQPLVVVVEVEVVLRRVLLHILAL